MNNNCICYEEVKTDYGIECFCNFVSVTKFNCAECKASEFAKKTKIQSDDIHIDIEEKHIQQRYVKSLEDRNIFLEHENESLKEQINLLNQSVDNKEHRIADFAILETRYVMDIRQK